MSHEGPDSERCGECGEYLTALTLWHRNGDRWLCDRCFKRRRILYPGRRVSLTFNPRRGMCQVCGKSVAAGEIGGTVLDHVMYVACLPWAATVELCRACHGDVSYERGQLAIGKFSSPEAFFGKGETNPRWRGGAGQKNQRWRKTAAYDRWREAVFKRDNYACASCGVYFGNNKSELVARHIRDADNHPELRCKLNNGQTWCRKCYSLDRSKKKVGDTIA